MSDPNISDKDKNKFNKIISDKENISKNITKIPNSILNKLLNDSYYKNTLITKEDKINLLKNNKIPSNLKDILFEDITVKKIKITSNDQVKFLEVLSSIDKNTKNTKVYKKLDKMPKSVRTVIEPNMNMQRVKKITIYLIIIYIISALFSFSQSFIMTTVSNRFAQKLRENISKKINKLPLRYFDKQMSGDILSRVTNDVDTIAQTMNQSLGTLVTTLTLFLGSIIMMFYTNYIMALTAIFSSIFGFIFMGKILSKSQKYFIARQKELGNLNSHIEEVYTSLNVVKVYNGKKISDKKFDEYNKKVYEANRKSQFLSGLMMPMMGFIGNFGYVCVCIVGAILAKNDIITFGVIVAFMTYVRLFTQPLSQLAQSLTSLQSTAAASERVFEFIDEEEMKEEKVKEVLYKDKVKGNIDFEDIVFTYDGNDKPTINGFSAKVKNGQKIAIVGPTGAGKTTMVNLLMKFYDIDSGDIKIDNTSIKDLSRENIRELFTMVLQDTWMFDGTIKENIVYNSKNVSDEKVKEVCKTVGLHHFIKTLPKGSDTKVSDNDSISQGQRQLLTIARAMIDETPFLILDEATSNVDTRTEELVQNAMDKLTKGKTSFIIAHRLSTIKNADLILVMKDGNIIEQGNHNELMNKNGFYAELYNSQFEL
ncbi:MAG: ABC transporter ATP-binding protein [Bacilli bacterium]|nr:ABC transporter ATP-binding protein [Bacilli bacterium]MBO6194936.1 ABC transporter ATP-binding protein [Bacilli bacterium]